jgi:WD40 repeat protein
MLRLCCLLSLLLGGVASAVAPPVPDALPAGARFRIGTARLRHGGLVRGLAFSPDGASLASVGHDGTASVWEVPGGRELFRFRGHEGDVLAVAFSHDGSRIATGGSDGTARLWAVTGGKAGQLVHTFNLRADSCEALAFDPSGKWLAVGTEDGKVRLVGTSSLKEEASFVLERAVRSLAWSDDGSLLAAGGDHPGIVVWDAGAKRAGMPFGQVVAQCLAYAPGGRDVVSWEAGGAVTMWDVKGRRRWRAGDGAKNVGAGEGLTYQIAFGRDGKHLFAGSSDGCVDRFTATGGEIPSFAAHRGRVAALAVSERYIATGGADHAIRLWDAKTLAPVLPAASAGPVVGLSLAAKGDRLLAVYTNREATLYERTTGRRIAVDLPTAKAAVLSLSGHDSWLVNTAGRLVRCEETEGPPKALDKEEPPLTGIASDAAGRSLLTSHADGSLWLRSAAGLRRRTLDGIDRGSQPLLSPDGSLAVAFGHTAHILLWDARTTKGRPPLLGHRGGTLAAAFVSETRLISGGRDRMLRVWDVKTGTPVRRPIPQDDWITAVAADPSGKLLVSATRRGDISVWWAETGRLLADFEGHRGAVSSLALSADGKTLYSGGQDTTILAWDIADLQEGKARPAQVSASRAQELWGRMRDPNLGTATLAMNRLARDPARAWATVKDRLAPVDGVRIAKLIARLDSEKYAEREQAAKALAAIGRFAEGPMERVVAKKPTAQVRSELLRLLDACATAGPAAEHRQALLAVDLLGLIGTPEAKALLRRLAGGAADAELTLRAKKALP